MVDIRRVDLRLLLVFEALMAERNVTRAARRVGMTQPAVSNALNRLRHLVGDTLFLRGVGTMRPTPRAIELAGPVTMALRQLQLALEPSEFNPAEAERTFRLAMSAHAAETLLPPLMRHLSEHAPGIGLHVVPKSNQNVAALLDSHEIEFAIGVISGVPERFSTLALFDDRYVAVMRHDHPLAKGELDMDVFLAAPQVRFNPTGSTVAQVDEELQHRKLQRNVVVTVNQLLVCALIAAQTNLITTVFQRTAQDFDALSGFNLVSRPLNVEPVRVDMIWHPGLSNHPACTWLREVIVRFARTGAAQPPLHRKPSRSSRSGRG